jgi:hypothetical protein
MAFADLKNDFVFRRIFATHPDILRGLLNDLLERTGDRTIAEVPADLSPGPYREALELANKATFTQEELDAYQKVIDEIQQVRELAEAKWAEGNAAGHKSGLAEGAAAGQIAAILAVLAARGISVTAEARARIEACKDEATLDRWIARAAIAASAEDVLASPAESS